MFRDSPEEARLRESINSVAEVVAMADDGRVTLEDLRDVLDKRRPELQELYDAVAARHGARAPRRILKDSSDIAALSTGSRTAWAARDLMRQVLESLDRPL